MAAGLTPIPLEPVDGVSITTLVDNVCDMLLADQGQNSVGTRFEL